MLLSTLHRYAVSMFRSSSPSEAREDPFQWLLTRRGIVQLKTRKAFRGVIWERRGPFLVLKDAQLIEEAAPDQPVSVDGEVIVDHANIDFIQLLEG